MFYDDVCDNEDVMRMLVFQLQILLLIFIGYHLGKKGVIDGKIRSGLSRILTDVIMPANIINAFAQKITRDTLLYQKMIAAFVISAVLQTVFYVFGKVLYGKETPEKGPVLRYGLLNPGMAFFGIPIMENLYGSIGTLLSSVYMIPYRLTIWTIGIGMFQTKDRRTWKEMLLHPCIAAVMIGIVLMATGIELPLIIAGPVNYLSRCVTGLSMLVVGSVLCETDPKTVFNKETLTFASLRLLILPFLVLGTLTLLKADPVVRGISSLMTGMPAAAIGVVIAQRYGGDDCFCAKIVVATTILSMITVPFIGLFL